MSVLKRDFLPEHIAPILNEYNLNIKGCVAVQADQSETETEFLLALSDKNSLIKGVVGWVDLCADNINERLDYFSQFKNLKGFRHILQAEPRGFMSQKKFLFGISQLEKHNFTYDILIDHHQLEEAIELVKHFPNQKFVIDHLAKPDIKQKKFEHWAKGIAQLASFQNVFCKISGFTTQAHWEKWKPEHFELYFDLVLVHFGAKRLLYGSDWPVCLLAATYKTQWRPIKKFVARLSKKEKRQVMGGNAVNFYNL